MTRIVRRLRAATLLGFALLVAACREDSTAPEAGGTYPVVHAVLNPSASNQWVLVEEALTGTVTPGSGVPYDPREAILTGGGRPVSFAQVQLTNSRHAFMAHEIGNYTGPEISGMVLDGRGKGMYFWLNYEPPPPKPGDPPPPPGIYERVFAGETWELEIQWPDGSRSVRGSTTVPKFSPLPSTRDTTLDRDRDTLVIELPGPAAALDAARYLIRLATPYGPMTFFTDSARVRLAGSLVNIDAPGAPRAFVPGFVQTVEIAAVDRNYFDYYRSEGNVRGGSLLVSHLSGAGGVFGSYTPLGTRTVTVVARQDQPGEGAFGRTTAPGDTLDLYLDSGNRLTGQRRGGGSQSPRGNLVGTLSGTQVELAFVSFQGVSDTLATFSGQLQGTAIVGRFSNEAQNATFQRAP